MENAVIEVNNKKYNVLVARTEEERETGLQDKEELAENEGMLFVFPEEQHVDF